MEIIVFILGGFFYGIVEILYRGHTHWTMLITGGAIVLTFFILLPILTKQNIIISALWGALIITCYEFFTGIIVNRVFHWHVWDYSDQPGNILGQICPLYTAIWFGICLAFFAFIKYNKLIF